MGRKRRGAGGRFQRQLSERGDSLAGWQASQGHGGVVVPFGRQFFQVRHHSSIAVGLEHQEQRGHVCQGQLAIGGLGEDLAGDLDRLLTVLSGRGYFQVAGGERYLQRVRG